MLFAVISEPRAEPPSAIAANRERYWSWIEPLLAAGTVRQVYARTGRGALAILDVDSNDTLHRLLNEWAELIPAHFNVYPLVDPAHAKAYLAQTRR